MARRKQTPIAGNGLSPLPSGPCCLSSVDDRKDAERKRKREWARKKRAETSGDESVKKKRNESLRAWRAKDIDAINAKRRAKYKEDPQKILDRQKADRGKERERRRGSQSAANKNQRKRYRENTEKAKKRSAATGKACTEKMADCYIRRLLVKDSDLSAKDIPQELVELKRKHLKIHRQLKNNKP